MVYCRYFNISSIFKYFLIVKFCWPNPVCTSSTVLQYFFNLCNFWKIRLAIADCTVVPSYKAPEAIFSQEVACSCRKCGICIIMSGTEGVAWYGRDHSISIITVRIIYKYLASYYMKKRVLLKIWNCDFQKCSPIEKA